MELNKLQVSNFKLPPSGSERFTASGLWVIHTCQRYLVIGHRDSFEAVGLTATVYPNAQHFSGGEAYETLLRISTGLESLVPGETEVFGQIRASWKQCAAVSSSTSLFLHRWVQRLYEDVKEIRSRYLQGNGGSSYGSLARRLLNPTESDRVLLIGAGQLGEGVVPFFNHCDKAWLWNRSGEHAETVRAKLGDRADRFSVVESPEDLMSAWRQCTLAVICIPDRGALDLPWMEAFRGRKLLHLGYAKKVGRPSEWDACLAANPETVVDLASFFEWHRKQGNSRLDFVEAAKQACRERAFLRELGGSLSIPHGWEDLACFA